jgi:hypothetical protein
MLLVRRLNSLVSRSMMFVVLNACHSSGGNLKKVKHASSEFSRHFTAEGTTFSQRSLKTQKTPYQRACKIGPLRASKNPPSMLIFLVLGLSYEARFRLFHGCDFSQA